MTTTGMTTMTDEEYQHRKELENRNRLIPGPYSRYELANKILAQSLRGNFKDPEFKAFREVKGRSSGGPPGELRDVFPELVAHLTMCEECGETDPTTKPRTDYFGSKLCDGCHGDLEVHREIDNQLLAEGEEI